MIINTELVYGPNSKRPCIVIKVRVTQTSQLQNTTQMLSWDSDKWLLQTSATVSWFPHQRGWTIQLWSTRSCVLTSFKAYLYFSLAVRYFTFSLHGPLMGPLCLCLSVGWQWLVGFLFLEMTSRQTWVIQKNLYYPIFDSAFTQLNKHCLTIYKCLIWYFLNRPASSAHLCVRKWLNRDIKPHFWPFI